MTSNTEFGWIGWCNEANHDKVWGYFYRPTPEYDEWRKQNPYAEEWRAPGYRNVCRFWAARGKAMQFKGDVDNWEFRRVRDSKVGKYNQITPDKLIEIWPTFEEEMRLKLSFEVLAGNVK